MDLLVLGGTVFLGRHVVEAALVAGHRITLFHRGQSNPGLFPACEHVLGDRDGGLGALAGRRWDAVIDTSGYVPRMVRDSATRLAAQAAHYTFVSSISVYADTATGPTEDSPVGVLADPADETLTGGSYGPLKALCERAVQQAFPGHALIVRPGLIVGPDDPTDRFTWWTRRVARGGEVLAPGVSSAPVQLIDVRDLAQWMVRSIEAGVAGTFNATGPSTPLTLGEVLETCRVETGGSAQFTWVSERFLLDHGVQPWSELPLWVPAADEGFLRADASRACNHGLTFRLLADTARDTLEWDRTTPAGTRPKKTGLSGSLAGLAPDREARLLQEWRDAGEPEA